jgi:hypothetical protein
MVEKESENEITKTWILIDRMQTKNQIGLKHYSIHFDRVVETKPG